MSLRKDYENLPSLETIVRVQQWDFYSSVSIPAVARDPIFTPLFTAILGSGGFTIGSAFISYASIATAIATTALTIGLQALMAPKPPKAEDGKFPSANQSRTAYGVWGETGQPAPSCCGRPTG